MQVSTNYEKMEDLLRMHESYKQKLGKEEDTKKKSKTE